MPLCDQTELNATHSGFTKCNQEATERLWCPTWISAENGPMNLCAHHAKGFKPEHNANAKDGEWHWGTDADAAFQRARAQGIPTPQEQFKRWLTSK